jgi:O-antigen ligase
MSIPRFSQGKGATGVDLFGSKGWAHFWENRFLPVYLPLLLGVAMGALSALFIIREDWHFLLIVTFAVPAMIFFSRRPFVAVMVWMLVLPYFLNEPTMAGRIIYWIIHRAMIPAALAVVVLSDWLGLREGEPVRLGPADLAPLLFVGLGLGNIFLLNQSPVATTIQFYDEVFIPICMYWLIRLVAPSQEDLRRFLWVAFITVVVQASIGVVSWFAPELLPRKWIGSLEGARTVGSLQNAAVYTSTLLFSSLLLLHHAMKSRSRWLRVGLLLTFGLVLYCVFMSFSRGSWLGGSVILVALIFLYPKMMGRLAIILGIAVFVLSNTLLAGQVAWGYERLTGEDSQKSAEDRVIANGASIGMIQARPFLGWGYGNYDKAQRPFVKRVGSIRVHDATSHNTYLTIMAELGLISLLLYLFPAWWWLRMSVKVRRRLFAEDFENSSLLVMLWLVVLHMFIVTNLMDMIRFFPFGTTVWWMALGLIGNTVYPYLKQGKV